MDKKNLKQHVFVIVAKCGHLRSGLAFPTRLSAEKWVSINQFEDCVIVELKEA